MDMQGRLLAPGQYWFEDIEAGDHYATGKLVVTEAHIVSFAGLSGDLFDVHMDDEFAREQGFPGRIAHGLLVLALADGLKNRALVQIMVVASFGWNWKFKGPVLAGDRIGVAVRVIGKRISSKGQPLVNLGFSVTKQDGTEVHAGETTLLGRFRPKGAA